MNNLSRTNVWCGHDRKGTQRRKPLQLDYLPVLHSIYNLVSLLLTMFNTIADWIWPWMTSQLPGNLVLRKFGVRNWLTFIVVAWGAVQLGMGFVSAWYWLIVCRILLGTFEVRHQFKALAWTSLTNLRLGIFITIGTFHIDNVVCSSNRDWFDAKLFYAGTNAMKSRRGLSDFCKCLGIASSLRNQSSLLLYDCCTSFRIKPHLFIRM